MKKLEKSVPVIRFKGFSEAWEQRKLGDLVVDYVEKTSVQNQFPMLTSSQQKGIVLQEDYF
ncbi:type I restriction endonuclease subunit S, partial [Listeria monocytogenes]